MLVLFGESYYDIYTIVQLVYSSINISFNINNYTAMILYLITAVVIMVTLYAFYYLFFDPFIINFFTFILLFVKSMLFFTISADFLTMYLTWECIGLFSFFLISFFWYSLYAINAGFNAFTFGNLGDLSLFMAFTVIYFNSSSLFLTFVFILQFINVYSICYFIILLFLCSFSNSTQFGMHVWLPDAMEGPIPVSALIHAATLVIAGMILVIFIHPILEYWTGYLYNLIIFMSLIMSLSSATVIGNFDIKRYIAFSTILQISTSFFTLLIIDVNLGSFFFSFHMFYKSTLFIIAGVIVHNTFSNQDLRILTVYSSISNTLISTLIIFALFNSCSTWFTCGFYINEYIITYAATINTNSIYIEYINIFMFCLLLTILYSFFLIMVIFYYTASIGVFNIVFYVYDFEVCLFICGTCTLLSYLLLIYLNDLLVILYNYNIFTAFINSIYVLGDSNIYVLGILVLFSTAGIKSNTSVLIYLDVCFAIYSHLLFFTLTVLVFSINLIIDMILFIFYVAITIQNLNNYLHYSFNFNYILLLIPILI